jgi:hypothetical protein
MECDDRDFSQNAPAKRLPFVFELTPYNPNWRDCRGGVLLSSGRRQMSSVSANPETNATPREEANKTKNIRSQGCAPPFDLPTNPLARRA